MKFKVTKKDFMLFCIYCGILLYFCAIAVLNFSSFSTDGTFYGLLPFKAFTPQYIGFTLGLFVAALILIFTSVSSKIFSKDKGEGFGLFFSEKGSDGYSKWASDKDIKTDKNIVKVRTIDDHIEAAGVALVNNGKEMWVDNGEYHNLIIGSTGSGKSEFIITYILSMIINYHPYEVEFVLIDYKGGGLAGAFENKELGIKIPHLVGTITNLDVAEMNRSLVSIQSELNRRQKLFNETRDALGEGTIDIYKYQKLYREGVVKKPLAHLFII